MPAPWPHPIKSSALGLKPSSLNVPLTLLPARPDTIQRRRQPTNPCPPGTLRSAPSAILRQPLPAAPQTCSLVRAMTPTGSFNLSRLKNPSNPSRRPLYAAGVLSLLVLSGAAGIRGGVAAMLYETTGPHGRIMGFNNTFSAEHRGMLLRSTIRQDPLGHPPPIWSCCCDCFVIWGRPA